VQVARFADGAAVSKRTAVSTATAAWSGEATLGLSARSHAIGRPRRLLSKWPGGSSGLALAIRPLVVAIATATCSLCQLACEDRAMEDLVAAAIALVAKHPAVGRVEFAGSRARGTHEELSDWDFAVETSNFAAVARDLPTLVAPLHPLAEQWEPLGHFPVYQVMLRGPTKVEYLFLEYPQDPKPPVNPSKDTLGAINTHFWDWIWWLATKEAAGRRDLVYEHLRGSVDDRR
jgi:hypothetical protein